MVRVKGMVAKAVVFAGASAIVAGMVPVVAGATTPTVILDAHGSTEEAYVTGATPGDSLQLSQNSTPIGAPQVADAQGALVVRNLPPGSGYVFTDTTASVASSSFSVLSTSYVPSNSLYNQTMHVGLNYLTMRDGVKIAATVRLPLGATSLSQGPFPTVVEYSGYATAGPSDPLLQFTNPAAYKAQNQALLPSGATDVGAVVARLEGFATVSVQMRGSGCSGGAYDLLGYPSDFDGYDAIQTIGGQSWVAHHKVGMVGISYSGLSQLNVAGTQPPDLAAIAPLSPTDDLFSTGYPGGIYNKGFAAGWIADRIADAKVATATPGSPGQPWTQAEIVAEQTANGGQSTCLDNQVLHGQSESLAKLVAPGLLRDPSLLDPRSQTVWASKIKVPVFISGALQDEQTGPQWPALLNALQHDQDPTHVYANMINGNHIDSLDTVTASRWIEFLDIFVAQQVPKPLNFIQALGAQFSQTATGAKTISPPAIRFTSAPTPAAAKAAFEARTPAVRVLFDSGAGSLGAGALQPTSEADLTSWPPAGTVTTYHLGVQSPDSLGTTAFVDGSAQVSFYPDPSTRPLDTCTSPPASGCNPWDAQPKWDWTTVPAANGVAFQTPKLTANTTIVGPATLSLSLKSTAPTTDLQATITEVAPNGRYESYVTSGFLRSDFRTLLPSSTTLFTAPDYSAGTGALPADTFTTVKIPISPIGHIFRKGTRIRVVISAPGGDRPSWDFDTPATGGTVQDTIDLAGSSLAVNIINNTVTTKQPVCGSLRGEPCRKYTPLSNQS